MSPTSRDDPVPNGPRPSSSSLTKHNGPCGTATVNRRVVILEVLRNLQFDRHFEGGLSVSAYSARKKRESDVHPYVE
jgi:hypothetical protein